MSIVRIEVLRPFTHEGARYEPGRRLAVGDALAYELFASNKARIASPEPAPKPNEQPVAGKPGNTRR